MESDEAVSNDLSAVKGISEAELDQLLEFSPIPDDLEGEDPSGFQYHQTLDIPLNTTDLFREEDEAAPNEITRKYPEFTLSFSAGLAEPSLYISTQKTDGIDLTTSSAKTKCNESIFVHPQIKDEPLDLSLQSAFGSPSTLKQVEATGDLDTKDDFNLDFTVPAIPATDCLSKDEHCTSSVAEHNGSQEVPSCSGATPMDYLAISYSQASLNEAGVTANTRRELHSSQSAQQVDTTQIPSPVQLLYKTIKMAYSDFAFVYSLAAQMGQDRAPMDCFVHLKIGLLLSIASLEENPNRPPLSIIAIGPDFQMANLLMETIGDVAERFVGPHDDFKGPANKKGNPVWVEADPIVMARGGVYYVGDWGRLKAPRAFKILKIIECNRILLEKTSISVPLETAIWAHWRSYKYDTKDQNTFNKLLEIFGIPLIIEENNHEVLVDFMMEQASVQAFESTVDELSIGAADMREFLSVVSKRRVDLTNEASDILRKYFVASRMDRPDCLPLQSFTSLKLFAESFAKLSLRHDVITIDAVSAVYMTENFVQNIFGPGNYPPPKFESHAYIGAVDEHMVKFQEWLHQYIAQFHEE